MTTSGVSELEGQSLWALVPCGFEAAVPAWWDIIGLSLPLTPGSDSTHQIPMGLPALSLYVVAIGAFGSLPSSPFGATYWK